MRRIMEKDWGEEEEEDDEVQMELINEKWVGVWREDEDSRVQREDTNESWWSTSGSQSSFLSEDVLHVWINKILTTIKQLPRSPS